MLTAYNDRLKEIYLQTIFRYGKIGPDDEQLAFILQHVPQNKQARILDAGCGNGRYAWALSERGYKNILGVDLYDRLETQGAFEYQKASLEQLPLADGSVDFVYSNSVIYHLQDPADAVREFARVLKPGGKVVTTVHSKYSLFTLQNLWRMRQGKLDSVHLRTAKFYSPFQYKRLFEKQGFRVLTLDGYRLSFLAYPFYARVTRKLKKTLGMPLLAAPAKVSSNRIMRFIRSVFAYHTVIIAQKPQPSAQGTRS